MEIYALCDNRGRIRYIGKYGKGAERRLRRHWFLRNDPNKWNRPLHVWLRSQKTCPKVRVLAIVGDSVAAEFEEAAIVAYRKDYPGVLLNVRPEPLVGCPERRLWDEYRRRARDIQTGKKMSAETRAKMSASRRKWTMSEETSAKLSESKKKWWAGLTPKQRAEFLEVQRSSHLGIKLSPETRARMSIAQKARQARARGGDAK
jgi:hypothetical protein